MKNIIFNSKLILTTVIIMLAYHQNSSAQICCYWNSTATGSGPILSNSPGSIREFQVATNSNTRLRLYTNGQWQVNPFSGAGGFISTPAGQADNATFKILAGGTSGLVSYSFQTSDWGQNIQSYVGRANTVSYVVKWNGLDRFYVAGQGWLFANGAWFNSDRKLKENIKPIENALEKVLQLKGYSYSFKKEQRSASCDSATSPEIDGKIQIGLMADEVEAVVPEVVRTVDSNRKAVAYQNIVALLIESTKEQQKIINRLQTQIATTLIFSSILFVFVLIAMIYIRKIVKIGSLGR